MCLIKWFVSNDFVKQKNKCVDFFLLKKKLLNDDDDFACVAAIVHQKPNYYIQDIV